MLLLTAIFIGSYYASESQQQTLIIYGSDAHTTNAATPTNVNIDTDLEEKTFKIITNQDGSQDSSNSDDILIVTDKSINQFAKDNSIPDNLLDYKSIETTDDTSINNINKTTSYGKLVDKLQKSILQQKSSFFSDDNTKVEIGSNDTFPPLEEKSTKEDAEQTDDGSGKKTKVDQNTQIGVFIDVAKEIIIYENHNGYGKFTNIEKSVFFEDDGARQSVKLDFLFPSLEIKNLYNSAIEKKKVEVENNQNTHTFVIESIKNSNQESIIDDQKVEKETYFKKNLKNYCSTATLKYYANNITKPTINDNDLEGFYDSIKADIINVSNRLEEFNDLFMTLCLEPNDKLLTVQNNLIDNIIVQKDTKDLDIYMKFFTNPKIAFTNFPIYEVYDYIAKCVDEHYKQKCYQSFPILKSFVVHKICQDGEFRNKVLSQITFNSVIFYEFIKNITNDKLHNTFDERRDYFIIQMILKKIQTNNIFSNMLQKQVQKLAFSMFLYRILNELFFTSVYINNKDIDENNCLEDFDKTYDDLLKNNGDIDTEILEIDICNHFNDKYSGIKSFLDIIENKTKPRKLDHTLFNVIMKKEEQNYIVLVHKPFTNESFMISIKKQTETNNFAKIIENNSFHNIYNFSGKVNYDIKLYMFNSLALELTEKTKNKEILYVMEDDEWLKFMTKLNFWHLFLDKNEKLTDINNANASIVTDSIKDFFTDEFSELYVGKTQIILKTLNSVFLLFSPDFFCFINKNSIFEDLLSYATFNEELLPLFQSKVEYNKSLHMAIRQFFNLPISTVQTHNSRDVNQIMNKIFIEKTNAIEQNRNNFFIANNYDFTSIHGFLTTKVHDCLQKIQKSNENFDNLNKLKNQIVMNMSTMLSNYLHKNNNQADKHMFSTKKNGKDYMDFIVAYNGITSPDYTDNAFSYYDEVKTLQSNFNKAMIEASQVLDFYFDNNYFMKDKISIVSEFNMQFYKEIGNNSNFVSFFTEEFMNPIENCELFYGGILDEFIPKFEKYPVFQEQAGFFKNFATHIKNSGFANQNYKNIIDLPTHFISQFLQQNNSSKFIYTCKPYKYNISTHLRYITTEKLNQSQRKLNFLLSFFNKAIQETMNGKTTNDAKCDMEILIDILEETENFLSDNDYKQIINLFPDNKQIFEYYTHKCLQELLKYKKTIHAITLYNQSLSLFLKINIKDENKLDEIIKDTLENYTLINSTIQKFISFIQTLKNHLINSICELSKQNFALLKTNNPNLDNIIDDFKKILDDIMVKNKDTIEKIVNNNKPNQIADLTSIENNLTPYFINSEIKINQDTFQNDYNEFCKIYKMFPYEENKNNFFDGKLRAIGYSDEFIDVLKKIYQIYNDKYLLNSIQYLISDITVHQHLRAIFIYLSKMENVNQCDVFALVSFLPTNHCENLLQSIKDIVRLYDETTALEMNVTNSLRLQF